MDSIGYVALLRGINVGGNSIVKMETLKKTFEALGYTRVKTLLNSGNVLFESSEANPATLTRKIEETLKKTFGFEIRVILRTDSQIQALLHANPFKNITVTPATRLYVTFLSEKSTSSLKIPVESPGKGFRILTVLDGNVCSVLLLSPSRGTVDIMKIIEKEFGQKITTRSWNTVHKLCRSY